MHELRDAEELVAAVDHLPVGFDAEVAQQRDVGSQQLRHAAPVRRRVDVQHPGASQRRCELANAVERLRLDRIAVVVEVLVEQRHAFEQRVS